MEIRIAVATKPKETALTELSKLLLLLLVQCCCWSSLCTFSGAPIGLHPLSTTCFSVPSTITITVPFLFFSFPLLPFFSYHNNSPLSSTTTINNTRTTSSSSCEENRTEQLCFVNKNRTTLVAIKYYDIVQKQVEIYHY